VNWWPLVRLVLGLLALLLLVRYLIRGRG